MLVFALMDFLEVGDGSTQPLQVNSGITVLRLSAKPANMLMERGGCTEVVQHPVLHFLTRNTAFLFSQTLPREGLELEELDMT